MRTRDCSFVLRLTEDELRRLDRLVARSGYSRQAYLRSLIKGVVPADKPPPDYFAMMNELCSIGINLNQIARKAHVFGVIDAARYDEEVRELNAAISRIDDAVRLPRKL